MKKKATGTRGVYLRGRTYWINYTAHGERIFESAETSDKREAQSIRAARLREVREGTWKHPTARAAELEAERLRARLEELAPRIEAKPAEATTVQAWAETWIKRRHAAGVRTAHDEEVRLRSHVLPKLGPMALDAVKRSDVREVIAEMQTKTSEATGRPYAARTVLHVYAAMRLLFADAVADELIASTPCTLKVRRGELPAKRDADPRWRGLAVYSRAEAESLISDESIPEDRRVYYALQLLAGLRASEAAARRWRDLDTVATPLGRLSVHSQAEKKGGGERATKTGDVREVPVHPTLAALLAEWKLSGFPMWFGRHPAPDDLIVPSRHDGRSPRTKTTLRRLKEDLEGLGLRTEGRGRHAMRATFLTLLESDGANMAIASRATHAPRGDVVSGYLRGSWADLCREVGKLRLELRKGAKVLPLRRVANGPNGDDFEDGNEAALSADRDVFRDSRVSEGGFLRQNSGTDGTRSPGGSTILREASGKAETLGAQKPRKSAGRGTDTPQISPLSRQREPIAFPPITRAALVRAIGDAREAQRTTDADALVRLLADLDGLDGGRS